MDLYESGGVRHDIICMKRVKVDKHIYYSQSLLDKYFQKLECNVIMAWLTKTYTHLNIISCWVGEVHTEPWRRFSITAAFTFALLTIPEWVIEVNATPIVPIGWIA